MQDTTARLSELFTAYLSRQGFAQPAAELADELSVAGYQLEAQVLSGTAGTEVNLPGSAWHARRLWTGTHLPSDARSGDVWLDTCQLTPMLLIPRDAREEDEQYAWIDVRPVQRWQCAAFLSLARFVPRDVQLDPPLSLLEPGRLLQGAEAEAITDLTPDEARLCANWFGKAVCGQYPWHAARAYLSESAMAGLWATPAREWAGAYAEGAQLAISPATIDRDPDLELDSDSLPPAEEEMLFGEWAHSPRTTFRTCVYLQLGLLEEPGEDGAWYLPHRLVSRAPR